ncbi:hypothetical protein [uncultured Erythrobacter sp.]|uniref:hypothetical protein n=1 Tax=uncultured Erythrobacter sp. TaxID=263913 RepID=UPI00261B4559|nr:hypothetical protein [uncultured Erythrobacter sp.]
MTLQLKRHRNLEDGRVEIYTPAPDASNLLELGDPKRGSEMHHKKNAVFVGTLEMASYLIREYGFSLRMKGDLTGQRNLISAHEIEGVK